MSLNLISKLRFVAKTFKLNQKGVSLLETLVATGILVVVVSGVITLMVQTKKQTNSQLGDHDARELFTTINSALTRRLVCTNTFVGLNPTTATNATPVAVTNIKDEASGVMYDTTATHANGELKIDSISIVEWKGKNAANVGLFRVKISIRKLMRKDVGPDVKDYYGFISAKISGTNIITDCYAFIDDEFVNKIGDTMTGPLIITYLSGGAGINLTSSYMIANYYLEHSDQNLKHNIHAIQDSEKILKQLNGVEFNWNSNNKKDWGFIAQNVESIAPHLVITDPETNLKSVKYSGVIPVLVEKYKILLKRNNDLKIKINKLSLEVDGYTKSTSP